ncbi:MAG: hypothetical protein QCH99_00020 [Candidatus Bathyarchaeota archaeon]|nr:hypothetical protein [Candidatus Bathyarchaeum tardum]
MHFFEYIFLVKAPNGTEIHNMESVSEGTEFEFMADQVVYTP